MNDNTLALTAELRDELATSSRRKVIDPRDVPVRFSTLKALALSPAHYWQACQDAMEETLSIRLGSGVDALLFGKPIAVFDKPARKGKGKAPRNGEQWEEFQKENAGSVILIPSEKAAAERMAKAITSHDAAKRVLFKNTRIEERINWDWDGRAFRSTPDVHGNGYLADLKALRSADPDKVKWQSLSLCYHAQLALYRRAMRWSNIEIGECYLVVVENSEPHPVSVFRYTEDALLEGDWLCVAWNERRKLCEETGVYSGYAADVLDLGLPPTRGAQWPIDEAA